MIEQEYVTTKTTEQENINIIRTELEKKTKELRLIKRDISIVMKENQKLQSELKIKNETINSLINQNFTELKSLQNRHEDIVNKLTLSYESNIQNMDQKYKLFRSSLERKLKNNVDTHYKLNNEKNILLSNHNTVLLNKLNELETDNNNKDSIIKELRQEFMAVQQLKNDIGLQLKEFKHTNEILETQLEELKHIYQSATDKNNFNERLISDLTLQKENLTLQLDNTNSELNRSNDQIKKMTSEIENLKTIYEDTHNRNLLLLNENINKQNNIDEKTLEIINMNSKTSEMEKRINLLESNRKELNVKVIDLVHQTDTLKGESLSSQKIIHQLKIEKDVILDEKYHYVKEYETLKSKFQEHEASILDRMKQLQEMASKEKERYIQEQDIKSKESKDKFDKQLMSLKYDYSGIISDKEKQIESLMSHVKSFTENQYVALNEIEKYKIMNEKLRAEQSNIDQKTSEIHLQYKRELDELRTAHKRERDALTESYNEAIKKSHEINDALQSRFNQSVEALGLTKTTISNLKDTNNSLEKQIQARETEDGSIQERYNELKTENLSLKEKLERSIELNNNFSNKEKQYEMQIKQLQTKYNQLILLTKKGMSMGQQQQINM